MDDRNIWCAIDSCSNPESVQQGIQRLKKMIDLGRLAEHALAEIEAKGSTFMRCPLAEDRTWGSPTPGEPGLITWHTFPPLLGVSRQDIPDFGKFEVRVDGVSDATYSGHPCKEVRIAVLLAGVSQKDWDAYDPITLACRPGKLRINKNHTSFVDHNGRAFQLYKAANPSAAAKESAEGIARRLEFVHSVPAKTPSQKTVDIRAQAPEWFIEDGHHLRLMEEMRRMSAVADVLSS